MLCLLCSNPASFSLWALVEQVLLTEHQGSPGDRTPGSIGAAATSVWDVTVRGKMMNLLLADLPR